MRVKGLENAPATHKIYIHPFGERGSFESVAQQNPLPAAAACESAHVVVCVIIHDIQRDIVT